MGIHRGDSSSPPDMRLLLYVAQSCPPWAGAFEQVPLKGTTRKQKWTGGASATSRRAHMRQGTLCRTWQKKTRGFCQNWYACARVAKRKKLYRICDKKFRCRSISCCLTIDVLPSRAEPDNRSVSSQFRTNAHFQYTTGASVPIALPLHIQHAVVTR